MRMKLQSGLMEYLIFIVIVMALIFAIVIFIFVWQFFSLGGEQAQLTDKKLDYLLDAFVESPVINNPNYQRGLVFDDSKLTAIASLGPEGCQMLESSMGSGWYAEVNISMIFDQCENIRDDGGSWWQVRYRDCVNDLSGKYTRACTSANDYPNCGVWKFCVQNRDEKMKYITMPVNIYRKMNNTVVMGTLKIGVSVQ